MPTDRIAATGGRYLVGAVLAGGRGAFLTTTIGEFIAKKRRLADETEPEVSPLWNEAHPGRPLAAKGS